MKAAITTIADAELEDRQLVALEACVAAAAAMTSEEGSPAERADLVIQCHGRLTHAWGPGDPAPQFAAFLEALRTSPISALLPGVPSGSALADRRLLDDNGERSAWLGDLALGLGDGAAGVPEVGAELGHLVGILRAIGKLPAGAALARISAEALQFGLFSSLLALGPTAYTDGRGCVVSFPVMTRRALADREMVLELGVYTDIAPSRQFAGRWMGCPICKWTMRARPRAAGKVEFACEDAAHRERGCRFLAVRADSGWQVRALGEWREVPDLVPVEGWVAVSFGLWRWITIPGLLEMELAERARDRGAMVQLWPGCDAYDLHIVKHLGTEREIAWRVDVKTWCDAQGIAPRMIEDPRGLDGLCVVIPEFQRGYLGVLNTVLGAHGARTITSEDLIDEVAEA